MNIDIEDVWELYKNINIGNDRLQDTAWELLNLDEILEKYLIEYYGVSIDYFYSLKEEYSPRERFDWSYGVRADLIEYVYGLAFELLRRDLEDYSGILEKAE